MQILALDCAGNPFRWLKIHRAIYYVAAGKIAWSVGDEAGVYFGGVRRSGERSVIALPPVMALAKSEAMVRHAAPLPLGRDNTPLYVRDRGICAYCGEPMPRHAASRDHIFPTARGGQDIWTNVVLACKPCNERKACRTPDEARMKLLYVPYQPCLSEHFLLTGRHVLADQMEYLSSRLPRHSRLSGAELLSA